MVLVVVCGAAIAADKPVQDPSVGPAAPSIYPQVHLQQPSRGYRTAPLAVSAAEARAREMIEAALQKRCEDALDFSDMPLRDVVSSLGETWNLPIRIDRKSLDEAGIDPETSITNVAVKGETLRGVLQAVLDDIDLTWIVAGERLVITTKEVAGGALITRLYPLPFGTAKQPVDFQPVIDAIVNTIGSPAAWADQGGDGQIRPAEGGEPMLVVSQTEELHAEVEALLRGMHDRALAEFLDDAGQPRRTPVVRIHRCADKKTRDELVASLAGLCNAALAADGDPAAKVTALGQHIVVQSSKADFQALAGQVVAATVGVRPLPSSGLGEAGYSGQGNAGFGIRNVAVPQPNPQPGNANEAGQGAGAGPAAAGAGPAAAGAGPAAAGAGPAAAGAGQAQARAPAPAAAPPAPAPPIYPQVHLQHPSRGYRVALLARSEAEARARKAIDAALRKGLDDVPEFNDKPLRDVVRTLENLWGLPIRIDHKSLDEAGIDPETSITAVGAKEETLRSVLQAVLDGIDLTWVVRGERLVITTKEKAGESLTTRLYPLPLGAAAQPVDFQPVIDAIVNTIGSPAAWADQGGDGQIRPLEGGEPLLVVMQTEEVHAAIETLLRGMHDRALAEFLDDAGQPRRTPVVRIYRCADKETRDAFVASLATLCNAALGDDDPAAKVTPLAENLVVQSATADFHALAAQIVAATVGVQPRQPRPTGNFCGGMGGGSFVGTPHPVPQEATEGQGGMGMGSHAP
jgi:hypothetical protein